MLWKRKFTLPRIVRLIDRANFSELRVPRIGIGSGQLSSIQGIQEFGLHLEV